MAIDNVEQKTSDMFFISSKKGQYYDINGILKKHSDFFFLQTVDDEQEFTLVKHEQLLF